MVAPGSQSERTEGQHPPLPCQASPPQGGRLAGLTAFANFRRCRKGSDAETANLPLAGEMSGRTEGGAKERQQSQLSNRAA
ncbi:hypothetical protein FJ976_28120 [Mesorhizobium sp. B1-1-9]|nr:hypothetical protein FJ976_28120 [Mesorhizobium sp. B1-1-9]TPN44196.1 hypothetical protein FJ978_29455 [Mesorhizobium sp. B1-1-7]